MKGDALLRALQRALAAAEFLVALNAQTAKYLVAVGACHERFSQQPQTELAYQLVDQIFVRIQDELVRDRVVCVFAG